MDSTMRDSSDSERSYPHQFSTSSPPPTSPPKLLSPPKSSPPEPVVKKEARELYKKLLHLRRHRSIGEETSQKFPVAPEIWLALQDELILNNETLHCNYDDQNKSLELIMPTKIHDEIAGLFGYLVVEKVTALTQGVPANAALQAIIDSMKRSIRTMDVDVFHTGTRRPDIAIHSGHSPPPFVGEVALSQNGQKDFLEIAEQYIAGTDGAVKTMVGLDIKHRNPEERKRLRGQFRDATYQIFRSTLNEKGERFVESTDKPIVFQDVGGVVNPSAHLRLGLGDLTHASKSLSRLYHIEFSHQELCDIVEEGEKMQDKRDNRTFAPTCPFVSMKKKSPSIDSQDGNASPEVDGDKSSTYNGDEGRLTSDDATSVSERDLSGGTKRKRPTIEGETGEETDGETDGEDGKEVWDEEAEEQVEEEGEGEGEKEGEAKKRKIHSAKERQSRSTKK